MSTIDSGQDYDFISTLTFASGSGTCNITFHNGSFGAINGTAYYRAGTSGGWTSLSVSGTSTTFPVSSTTMQIANNWSKNGDNYTTQSFRGQSSNLTKIAISLKAVLTGTIGSTFMGSFAWGCSSLTSLDIPDTSGVTSVGSSFMDYYANECSSLERLILPSVGWFATNNVTWRVPSSRLNNLKGYVKNPTDLADWQDLVVSGETLYTNYIRSTGDVLLEATITNVVSIGNINSIII